MKYGIYSFRDIVIGSFMGPFIQINEDVAKRSALNAAADQRSTIHNVINDIEFWKLGTFDDQTGEITGKAKIIFTAGAMAPGKQEEK